ncbi:MAG: hypothetical protein RBT86_04160 [Azospira sp.]|jgi:hypothetical protein|nr:hypothetical protein [Azospira sp.]
MTNDNPSLISRIFPALMLFCLLTGAWSYAIIQAWPWDKTPEWKPGVRLPVTCANGEVCSKEYAAIARAVEEKQVISLKPTETHGELHDGDLWLRWSTVSGKDWEIEAAMSSWYFETAVRYSVNEDKLVAVQYRHYDAKIFFYAIGAALFTLIGIYLRRLRK